MKAVESRGVYVIAADTKESALAILVHLIPEKAAVMTGASLTLRQIGFEESLKSGNHPWRNMKGEIVAEKDPVRQSQLRKKATRADYFLGSVHAIAETERSSSLLDFPCRRRSGRTGPFLAGFL